MQTETNLYRVIINFSCVFHTWVSEYVHAHGHWLSCPYNCLYISMKTTRGSKRIFTLICISASRSSSVSPTLPAHFYSSRSRHFSSVRFNFPFSLVHNIALWFDHINTVNVHFITLICIYECFASVCVSVL